MSILRASARRNMSKSPQIQRLPKDYELDWLATRFPKFSLPNPSWNPSRESVSTLSQESPPLRHDDRSSFTDNPAVTAFWGLECVDLDILIASDTGLFRIEPNLHHRDSVSYNQPDPAVKVRIRLGALTRWGIREMEATCAKSLADAIDVVMTHQLFRILFDVTGGRRIEAVIFLASTGPPRENQNKRSENTIRDQRELGRLFV